MSINFLICFWIMLKTNNSKKRIYKKIYIFSYGQTRIKENKILILIFHWLSRVKYTYFTGHSVSSLLDHRQTKVEDFLNIFRAFFFY